MIKHAIIGLGDRKQVGKDTYATFLIDILTDLTDELDINFDAKLFSFADHLKRVVALKFGISYHVLSSELFKNQMSPYGMTWRKILQIEGTENTRERYSDTFWIDKVAKDIDQFFSRGGRDDLKVAIVTDVRFDNECEWIQSQRTTNGGPGTRVFKIDRLSMSSAQPDGHASESGLTLHDETIDNNGTLDDLHAQAKAIAKRIIAGYQGEFTDG